jgi:transposase
MKKREYKIGTEITDKQWEKIEPHLSGFESSKKGGQKPASKRICFEAVLWMARSGARWKDLPRHFPSASTVWKRLYEWEEDGSIENAWRQLLKILDQKGRLNWEECFADGTFSPAKKGENTLGRPSVARAQSLWWWQMARVYLWEFSPNPHRPTSAS